MRPSLEAMLEVDKLIEAKRAGNASIVNQGPLEELKDKQSGKEEEVEDEISDEPTDEPTDSEASSEGDDDAELNDAMEHLSSVQYDVSVESWDDVRYYGTQALNGLASVAKQLAMLGVTYTPIIATKLYKGVAYMMTHITKHLFKSIFTITKYIERRMNSINTLKNSITGLKHSIEQIKQSKEQVDLTEFKYTQESTINALKIGDSVDFVANLSKLDVFLNETIIALDKRIQNEIASVRHIISSVTSGSAVLPSTALEVQKLSGSMEEGGIAGYINDNELLHFTHYKEVLPGDVVFLSLTPNELPNEMEQISKAYNASKMFFGINSDGYVKVSTIDHMNIEQLSEFVNSLDKLCSVCEQHQKLYENIKDLKLKLRFSFRDYFKMLIASSVKVSIKDSLVNLVYLKTIFTDKVYLVTAMDIHDYTAKTISSGISLAKDHIKRLQ